MRRRSVVDFAADAKGSPVWERDRVSVASASGHSFLVGPFCRKGLSPQGELGHLVGIVEQ